jgi:hypothetical protein
LRHGGQTSERRPLPYRATFDADCDPQTLQTPRRADLVVILHAVARIAAQVRRG